MSMEELRTLISGRPKVKLKVTPEQEAEREFPASADDKLEARANEAMAELSSIVDEPDEDDEPDDTSSVTEDTVAEDDPIAQMVLRPSVGPSIKLHGRIVQSAIDHLGLVLEPCRGSTKFERLLELYDDLKQEAELACGATLSGLVQSDCTETDHATEE